MSHYSLTWKCGTCGKSYNHATRHFRQQHLWGHLRENRPRIPVSELRDGYELHPADLLRQVAFVLGCQEWEAIAAATGETMQWPAEAFLGRRKHLREAVALAGGSWPWAHEALPRFSRFITFHQH